MRRAGGFQNLVGTSVYGGHNLPLLEGIGLRWLSKLGVDKSPRPHAHKRACSTYFKGLYQEASAVDCTGLFIYLLTFSIKHPGLYKQPEFKYNKPRTTRSYNRDLE